MPEARVIIEHEDGRRYSVTPKAHTDLYPDFKVVGEETDDAFTTVGIPAPKRGRKQPAAKNAKPIDAKPIPQPVEPVIEPEPATEPEKAPEA